MLSAQENARNDVFFISTNTTVRQRMTLAQRAAARSRACRAASIVGTAAPFRFEEHARDDLGAHIARFHVFHRAHGIARLLHRNAALDNSALGFVMAGFRKVGAGDNMGVQVCFDHGNSSQ
jgi:hypothetical protein